MAEPVYEYLGAELVSGAFIAPLPLNGVKYGLVLNGAGAASANVKLEPLPPTTDATSDAVRERNRVLKDATGPALRVCYVLRDGVLVAPYVWWTRGYDPATQSMAMGGAELWSLLRRRRITWQSSYTAQDQLDIARDIITRAMAVAGGNLGLTFDSDDSGVTRDRSYFDYEAKPVAEAVEQLAGVIDGFDFSLTASLSGGTVTRNVELDFPRRGRTAAQSGHVFEWGRNIVNLDWVEDATSMANSIIGLGTGEGIAKVRTRITDTTAFAGGYPLLEDSVSYGDVEDPATLDGHVRAALAQRSRPLLLPRVKVRGSADPPLGSYLLGDDCHLVVPADVDPFWPDGLVTSRRIHAIEVTPPEDGGVEMVELVLGEATAGV